MNDTVELGACLVVRVHTVESLAAGVLFHVSLRFVIQGVEEGFGVDNQRTRGVW